MTNKQFRSGPIALTTTYTTNLLNPPAASGGVNAGSSGCYILIKHISIINKSGSAATFRLFLGATGGNVAGTEVCGYDTEIAVGGKFDYYGSIRLDTTDFLVGGASANAALTLLIEGEIGVAG